MYKIIINKIKSDFLYYLLIFIGYVTSLIIISFSFNLVELTKQNQIEWTNGDIKHQKKFL